ADALGDIGKVCLRHFRGGRALVVTDTNVAPLYAEKTLALLGAAGVQASVLRIPAGEASKSMRQLSRILDRMASMRLDRGCGAVALGGGVVGDITGFAAAVFLRGVPYV
ncbi:MAG: 3-dehydroquinate synthase, partial [Nitrospinae bacterium]|nr:3-dehydroquinate synthase [Nitrospinota bacterium]